MHRLVTTLPLSPIECTPTFTGFVPASMPLLRFSSARIQAAAVGRMLPSPLEITTLPALKVELPGKVGDAAAINPCARA